MAYSILRLSETRARALSSLYGREHHQMVSCSLHSPWCWEQWRIKPTISALWAYTMKPLHYGINTPVYFRRKPKAFYFCSIKKLEMLCGVVASRTFLCHQKTENWWAIYLKHERKLQVPSCLLRHESFGFHHHVLGVYIVMYDAYELFTRCSLFSTWHALYCNLLFKHVLQCEYTRFHLCWLYCIRDSIASHFHSATGCMHVDVRQVFGATSKLRWRQALSTNSAASSYALVPWVSNRSFTRSARISRVKPPTWWKNVSYSQHLHWLRPNLLVLHMKVSMQIFLYHKQWGVWNIQAPVRPHLQYKRFQSC